MTSTLKAAGLGALALALMSTAAGAGELGLRGSLDVDYNNVSGDNDTDANLWNFNGTVVIPVGPNFNVQVGGGYHNLDGDVVGGNAWDARGAVFWRGARGDVGLAVAHGSLEPDDSALPDFDLTAFGAFGEFFASERFTIAANGGFIDGDNSLDGNYYGGSVKFYILPTLSIAANASRVHFDDIGSVTNFGATAEWQVMNDKPFTVYAGYTNSDFSGTDFNTDTFTIGLRWRFGEEGATSLVQSDRTNAVRNTTVDFSSAFTF